VEKIQAFIKDRGLDLIYATKTHSQADHTMGTSELIKKLNAKYKDHKITAARQFEPHNPNLDEGFW
jgi:glyoxylase-like metal-dependent hydrolase (beta-lactamase superfamily II)